MKLTCLSYASAGEGELADRLDALSRTKAQAMWINEIGLASEHAVLWELR